MELPDATRANFPTYFPIFIGVAHRHVIGSAASVRLHASRARFTPDEKKGKEKKEGSAMSG